MLTLACHSGNFVLESISQNYSESRPRNILISGYRLKAGMTPTAMNSYYVYILASGRNGTLYIGVTSDLIKRVWEHKNKVADGFTKRYGIDQLMYFEETSDVESAIAREKQLKNWTRKWKLELIEKSNSNWLDLYNSIV